MADDASTQAQITTTTPAVDAPGMVVRVIGLTPAGSGTSTPSAVAASLVAVTILSANTARTGGTIVNANVAGAGILFLKLGVGATLDLDIPVVPAGYYEIPFGYTGIITGVWSAAAVGSQATINELTP